MVVTFLSLKGAQASWENWRRGRLLVFAYVSTQGFPRFPKSCLPSYSLKAFLISLSAVYLEAFSFRTERKPTATKKRGQGKPTLKCGLLIPLNLSVEQSSSPDPKDLIPLELSGPFLVSVS